MRVDEVAQEPEHRAEVLEVEDPEARVDEDHEHEPGVAEDHGGAAEHLRGGLGVLRAGAGPGRGRASGGASARSRATSAVKHKFPGEALEVADDERRKERAEVDHPVVDAEAEAGVLLGGRAGEGSGDDRLEEPRARGHDEEGGEDRAIGAHVPAQEVPGGQEGERHQEHAPVSVAVGKRSAQDRHDVGEGVDEALEEARRTPP